VRDALGDRLRCVDTFCSFLALATM
jgi:hypothetical protein